MSGDRDDRRTYDALRSAGADEDKARQSRDEMKIIEINLQGEMQGIRIEMQGTRGELATLKWMNSGLLAIAAAIFVRLLFA